MIKYTKHKLSNGLTVICHKDASTTMAAVNLIYKVGAKNEDTGKTGFAHLFEHLMFGGSENVPDFDLPLQLACGENNAFTNNDYTDYYMALPQDNIETAFWIESDRMNGLVINEHSLEVQRKVVIEEFNQRYLNQPYGDLWMLERELCYKVHPYRWATIGMSPDHIREANLEDVKLFYNKYYRPDNAILSIASGLDPDKIFNFVEKWFSDIPAGKLIKESIPQEPEQHEARRCEVLRNVPATVIMISFHIAARTDREFYICDVISDVLSNGSSSRLYQNLVKKKNIFSSVNAYLTGEVDPGLFVFSGNLLPGIDPELAEHEFWNEIDMIKTEYVSDYELEKINNKFESGVVFGEVNVMNKAMNLGYYEMINNIDLINNEVDIHNSVTKEEIRDAAVRVFRKEKSNTLIYKGK